MNDTFKIGDVVAIVTDGSWHCPATISEPITIEKVHKGNGNMLINGEQWTAGGWSRGDRSYSVTRRYLVRVGTPEHARAVEAAERSQLASKCQSRLHKLDLTKQPIEWLRELLDVLRKLPEQREEAKP